ncbi:MAG: hypothetical protein HYX26_00675 [Acidobacteriales bacterium]|nr:hypothetical protein [Terriglobales bacterium]
MIPPPWHDFLNELDLLLSREVELVCVGGFVLAALHGNPRVTGDLDFLEIRPTDASDELLRLGDLDSRLAQKHKVYLQRLTGIVDPPDAYEDRLVSIETETEKLKLFALEPIDLILAKLSRNSPKDREDIRYLAHRLGLGFGQVKARYEAEMKDWIPNPDKHATTLDLVWKDLFPVP